MKCISGVESVETFATIVAMEKSLRLKEETPIIEISEKKVRMRETNMGKGWRQRGLKVVDREC